MNNLTIGESAVKSLACVFKIQQEVTFTMTGKNRQGGGYSYFKLEDLVGPIKPILHEHQCVLLFTTNSASVRGGFEKVQGNKDAVPRDKLVTYAECMVTARIQNINDIDDYVASQCFGYKVDQTADKALGADTVGARYALMHIVLAGSEFDPDSDEHDVRTGLLGSVLNEQKAPAVSQPSSPYSNKTTSLSDIMGTNNNAPAPNALSSSSPLSDALSILTK